MAASASNIGFPEASIWGISGKAISRTIEEDNKRPPGIDSTLPRRRAAALRSSRKAHGHDEENIMNRRLFGAILLPVIISGAAIAASS